MGRQRGWAAFNLEMPPEIPHTQYSMHAPWLEHLRRKHGKPNAGFEELLDFDFIWNVDLPATPRPGRCTDMGHAVFAADGSDYRLPAKSPFDDDLEAIYTLDPFQEYGRLDEGDVELPADGLRRAAGPERQEFANQAMALLAMEMQRGIDGMPWAQLQGLYDAFVAVLDRFRATWPVAEPPIDQSAAMNLLANAALIGGDVAKARELHQQALDLHPSAQAYLEFGQMEARAGDPARARELLQAGLAVGTGDLTDRTLAQASIHEELGLLEAAQGNRDVADESFDEAIDAWKQLGRAGALPEAQVDAKIGVLQVRSGQRQQGLQRIALAVREAGEDEFGPDEDSVVYNDALSFLHMQGERELLTELFPQAATRQDLNVEWRVYYALWTLGASRRDRLPDDPETLAYLMAIRATDWSGVLARFYRGDLTFDAALASARTLGQQTELRYYEALNRIDAGDREGARTLLQQVIDTHIFNYFEWEMARHTLAGLDAAPPAAAADAQPGAAVSQPDAAASVSR